MVAESERFSISELTREAQRVTGLDENQLSVRLVRDYVQRVLQERPGQGKRAPYDASILHKLLFLLEFREKAPHLELQTMGQIINHLPPDVVRRVASREERLEIPDLQNPETFMRLMRGEIQPQPNETGYEVTDAELTPISGPTGAHEPMAAEARPALGSAPDQWTEISAPPKVRLQVAGEITPKKRRQLELLAKLIHELVS